MLNLTPQRRKASAKVEQNPITTKHTTNFFYAKTKIISGTAKFDMQKWQNKEIKSRKYTEEMSMKKWGGQGFEVLLAGLGSFFSR